MADKVSGTLVGLWLLIPEHLRLGTWDLLCGWTQKPGSHVAPRLALQLVHEAALCVTGIRQRRCLSQKGFELANGLPFVASDPAIHALLDAHTVAQAQQLQIALGQLRRASGHYRGKVLAVDPHRMRSYSKRQMRHRRDKPENKAVKTAQTFFCLDTDTFQPICFTIGTAARTVSEATPELLEMAAQILPAQEPRPLLLADTEHHTAELFDSVRQTPFDLLVPIPGQPHYRRIMKELPHDCFTHRWAGLATAKLRRPFSHDASPPIYHIIQRCGEKPSEYKFKGFYCTADRDELQALVTHYPRRWHVEEFFNANQDLGWKRAGTLNLHIRYGQMTTALIAQTVLYQLRQRLHPPIRDWNAAHLARGLLQGLDGDIRVIDDTIVVTYYNAPHADQLRAHYENLPQKLLHDNVNPSIPWLYDFKLDFRFK